MNRKFLTLMPLGAALLLAACGGGSASSDTPAPPMADPLEVPAAASQSSAGLVGYLDSLPAQAAEMREPVSVDSFVPPNSESEEPIAVRG